MKHFLLAILISFLVFSGIMPSFAESKTDEKNFLELADSYLQLCTDLSSKVKWEISASEYSLAECLVSFDFTEGNQTILVIDNNLCWLYATFEDDELMSILFQMVTQFRNIESQLADGKSLVYEMRFSKTEVHYIKSDTISKYYSWLFQ